MDKTEALERIAALEAEAAALRRIVDAPEHKPLVQAKNKLGHRVLWGVDGYYTAMLTGPNGFETTEQAEAYAEAFNTFLDLRRQPGTVPAEEKKYQWTIATNGSAYVACPLWHKITRLCPCFDSQESAEAAIKAVGRERIIRMMDTFHGRGYD